MERPSWDERFMFEAFVNATRSSCLYLHAGAVIVKDKRVIASGYNGAPHNIMNCIQKGCRKEKNNIPFNVKETGNCRGAHAESNAMSQIAREDLKGTTIYSVFFPCTRCAKEIVGNKIKEVVYERMYKEPDSLTKELFEEAEISIREFKLDINRYFDFLRKVYEQK